MKKNINKFFILNCKSIISPFSLKSKKNGISNRIYKTKLILKLENNAWKGIIKVIIKLEPKIRFEKTSSKVKIFFEK